MGTLHGAGLSPYVRKVRIALVEKGISYDHDPVVPFNMSDELKRMSPLGKIPVYTPKPGVHIPDSSVIIAYLERTQPKPALYPEDPEEMARALFLEEYGDGGLVPAAGPVFLQRVVRPRLMGQPTDEAVVKDHLENKLPPLLTWLNEQIGSRDLLVGNSFSIADIGILSPFVNLMHAGERIDASRYPNLARYLGKMLQRPSVEALIKEEQAFFKQAA